MTAALMIKAVEKEASYPALRSSGRNGPPMATTVAWVEPETESKSVQAMVVEIGIPPRLCPTSLTTNVSSRSATCPEVMMSAARMNRGTAVSDTG